MLKYDHAQISYFTKYSFGVGLFCTSNFRKQAGLGVVVQSMG